MRLVLRICGVLWLAHGISELPWEAEAMQDHVARGEPFVVRDGATAAGLPSLSPADLGGMRISIVKHAHADGFLSHFDPTKPWAPLASRDHDVSHNTTVESFFREPGALLYATVRAAALPANVSALLEPLRQLAAGDDEPPTLNLWLSRAGTTASMHYDTARNILAQLHGTKRLRIGAPAVAAACAAYPQPHPRHRQAATPTCGGVMSEEVTLRAGDALFLPPWYAHEVHALTDSVSASVWFGGDDDDDASAAQRALERSVLLPFDRIAPAGERAAAAAALSREVRTDFSIDDFVWRARLDAAHSTRCAATESLPVDDAALPRVRRVAATVGVIARSIPADGRRQLVGMDYLEQLAARALGDPCGSAETAVCANGALELAPETPLGDAVCALKRVLTT